MLHFLSANDVTFLQKKKRLLNTKTNNEVSP